MIIYSVIKSAKETNNMGSYMFDKNVCLGTGLCHLHAQRPPVIHGNFNTANVLVDENFIAKVADAGVARLLEKIDDDAGPSESSSSRASLFRDPE